MAGRLGLRVATGVTGAAAFFAALLFFSAQPLLAKALLPLLGGTPAVWNGCQLVFQSLLLLGYLWAELAARTRLRSPSALLHVAVLAGTVLAWPLSVPEATPPEPGGSALLFLAGTLLKHAGLPLLLVAATTPLLQSWLARAHAGAGVAGRDPWVLYAASNLGSLAGLLGYPLLAEPRFSLTEQADLWRGGSRALALLAAAAALATAAWERGRDDDASPSAGAERAQPIRWVALAFLPSALLLAATAHVTTDLAPVPLLWVLPLAVYLATWIWVFAGRARLATWLAAELLPPLAVALALSALLRLGRPLGLFLPLHLLGLLAAGLVFHGEVARSRPAATRPRGFYVWLALGGALGGVFGALVAPLAFRTAAEYPILLAVAAVAASAGEGSASPVRLGVLGLLGGALAVGFDPAGLRDNLMGLLVAGLVAAVIPLALGLRWRNALAALALALLVVQFRSSGNADLLEADRSFFGPSRVLRDGATATRALVHGTTVHGRQSLDPSRRSEPLTYFGRSGPVGDLIGALHESRGDAPPARVGVLGLGAGTLAAYAEPGERWTFFEIDPVVERIARDPRLFTYLADARGSVDVVQGDARLQLADRPDAGLDLLVMDAFASDSVPTHLLTLEAFELYSRKLAPGGLLAVNVSNRFVDLEPVVAAAAARLGLAGRVRHEAQVPKEDAHRGRSPSKWIVLARAESALAALERRAGWRPLAAAAASRLWADQRSDLFAVLRLGVEE